MGSLIAYIKNISFNFEGVFSRGSSYEIPEELEKLYSEIYINKGKNPRHIDKQNMRADFDKVYRHFKKVLRSPKVRRAPN